MDKNPDTGLLCLTVMAQLFERKTNPQQLRHLSGNGSKPFDETDILRGAKTLDLKAKAVQSAIGRLSETPLPVIVRANDGRFFILAKYSPDKVLIHCPEKANRKFCRRGILKRCGRGGLFCLHRAKALKICGGGLT